MSLLLLHARQTLALSLCSIFIALYSAHRFSMNFSLNFRSVFPVTAKYPQQHSLPNFCKRYHQVFPCHTAPLHATRRKWQTLSYYMQNHIYFLSETKWKTVTLVRVICKPYQPKLKGEFYGRNSALH